MDMLRKMWPPLTKLASYVRQLRSFYVIPYSAKVTSFVLACLGEMIEIIKSFDLKLKFGFFTSMLTP